MLRRSCPTEQGDRILTGTKQVWFIPPTYLQGLMRKFHFMRLYVLDSFHYFFALDPCSDYLKNVLSKRSNSQDNRIYRRGRFLLLYRHIYLQIFRTHSDTIFDGCQGHRILNTRIIAYIS